MRRIDFGDTFAFPCAFLGFGFIALQQACMGTGVDKHIIICHLAMAGRAHDILHLDDTSRDSGLSMRSIR